MFILDSDVFGYYLTEPHNYPHLDRRVKEADARRLICTSVITVEEAMAGQINELRKKDVQSTAAIVQQYEYLYKLTNDLKRFIILPFDEAAYVAFQVMPRSLVKSAVNDCRIAAIALSRDYTVVTNNGKDFDRIRKETGVKVEYWVNAPLPA